MFIKLKLQTFWILLLVFSTLWVAVAFGSLLFSVFSPASDVWAIVHAMQGRQDPPPKAAAVVQTALDGGGRLALNPPTSSWGRSMLAKRGGLALQRKLRLEGKHPTAYATRCRVLKQKARKRAVADLDLPSPPRVRYLPLD